MKRVVLAGRTLRTPVPMVLTLAAARHGSSVTVPLAHGFHTVEFRHVKDTSLSVGRDQGWVDTVRFF